MSKEPYRLGKLTRARADGTSYWHWCIKWTDAAGPHRQSLGTDNKEAAKALAREFWSRLTVSRVETVGEMVEAYLNSLKGEKDEKRKREAWKAAKPFWAGLRPEQIDEETSGDYIAWRQRAVNTVRNELGTIRVALHWAAEKRNDLLDAGCVPPIIVPAMPDSEVEHLTKQQFARFLAGCVAPHVRLFAQLKVLTAARNKHLFELPWVRVDLKRRLINLKPPKPSKVVELKEISAREAPNKGRAIVPINDRLLPLLVAAEAAALTAFVIESNGEPIKSIKKGFEAASARSGVKCTPLMLRHSAAVWMAEARVPMSEIAAFLGHKNPAITARIYARYHPDYLRDAASALDWEDHVEPTDEPMGHIVQLSDYRPQRTA